MKSMRLMATAAAMIMCSGLAFGQDKAPAKPSTPQPAKSEPKQPEMDGMEEMMKAAMPGAEHKMLAKWEGEWDATTKWRMDPSTPWQESKATYSVKTMFEGRFIVGTFKGDMMGAPFTGMSHTGFNNVSKKFESTWFDSMSTGIMMMHGTFDSSTKTFTFTGESADPMSGKMKKSKMTEKWSDDNKVTLSMFDFGADGKEWENMQIVYTRKAGAGSSAKPAAPAGSSQGGGGGGTPKK